MSSYGHRICLLNARTKAASRRSSPWSSPDRSRRQLERCPCRLGRARVATRCRGAHRRTAVGSSRGSMSISRFVPRAARVAGPGRQARPAGPVNGLFGGAGVVATKAPAGGRRLARADGACRRALHDRLAACGAQTLRGSPLGADVGRGPERGRGGRLDGQIPGAQHPSGDPGQAGSGVVRRGDCPCLRGGRRRRPGRVRRAARQRARAAAAALHQLQALHAGLVCALPARHPDGCDPVRRRLRERSSAKASRVLVRRRASTRSPAVPSART